MLKEVFIQHIHPFHAIKFVSCRIVKWKISTSYLLCWTFHVRVGTRDGVKSVYTIHFLLPRFIFLQCMWPRSSSFYLLCKILWGGSSSLSLTQFTPVQEKNFMFFYILAFFLSLSLSFSLSFAFSTLKCKTCTNLNLFCGQIVWFRSFRRSRKKRTPHILPVYCLAVFWLPFCFFFLIFTLSLCSDFSSTSVNCCRCLYIFLVFHRTFHYE